MSDREAHLLQARQQGSRWRRAAGVHVHLMIQRAGHGILAIMVSTVGAALKWVIPSVPQAPDLGCVHGPQARGYRLPR